MKITDKKYFAPYHDAIGKEIPTLIANFDFSEKSGGFEYLTKASAVYSSNIEGNSIDLNSFMNYQLNKEKFKGGKEIEEIETLVTAYEFAQHNSLTEKNLLQCHEIFSETFLIKSKRGKYRAEQVGVFSKNGIAYLAVEPEFAGQKMEYLFDEIDTLLQESLTEEEALYFASFIHLRFAHIHPFMDGNGRAARLLEKWFLAEKLGRDFWKIPSEEHYKTNQRKYYDTIHLAVNYYELDYAKNLEFLLMLPGSLA
jgi:Fic family protein